MRRSDCKRARACVYIRHAWACAHVSVRLSIFGYHCRVVNVKELVLKVRHDAALWRASAESTHSPLPLWPGRTKQGRRADPLCLFLLYLSSPKSRKQRSNSSHWGSEDLQLYSHTCSCSQKYSGNERGRFEEGKKRFSCKSASCNCYGSYWGVVKQCQGDLTVYVGSLVLGWNLIEEGKTSLLVLLLWLFTGQHSALLGLWST